MLRALCSAGCGHAARAEQEAGDSQKEDQGWQAACRDRPPPCARGTLSKLVTVVCERKRSVLGHSLRLLVVQWEFGNKHKQQHLTEESIVYSYNIYVVLDQLNRMADVKFKLDTSQLEGLKKMVNDNDEDIFIYFEEYVEKSGPVYRESGDAWKALNRFATKAKHIYSMSDYCTEKDNAKEEGKVSPDGHVGHGKGTHG